VLRCMFTLALALAIQELNLSGNSIPSIPDALSNLVNLRSFSLANNCSEGPVELPATLSALTNLSRLYLRGSKISPVFPDLSSLVSCRWR
jgi:Leucine-rich repeat (LRR) protein